MQVNTFVKYILMLVPLDNELDQDDLNNKVFQNHADDEIGERKEQQKIAEGLWWQEQLYLALKQPARRCQ
jgi:hypothetical protein